MTVFQETREGNYQYQQLKPHSEHVTINMKQNKRKGK